jgi:type IV pilus biogenesis protein CpaD/CtpE
VTRVKLTREEREHLKRLVDRVRRAQLKIVVAEVFLRDELETGPRDARELVRAARAQGINQQALRAAARRLGVQGGRDDPTWRLPT